MQREYWLASDCVLYIRPSPWLGAYQVKYQPELAHTTRRRTNLEVVLIDKFIVPERSKQEFLEQVHKSANFLRMLPGFVEGFVYEKTEGDSRYNIMTAAVWKDEEAFQNAKKSASDGFKRIGFNPSEIMRALNVQIERSIYRRSPY